MKFLNRSCCIVLCIVFSIEYSVCLNDQFCISKLEHQKKFSFDAHKGLFDDDSVYDLPSHKKLATEHKKLSDDHEGLFDDDDDSKGIPTEYAKSSDLSTMPCTEPKKSTVTRKSYPDGFYTGEILGNKRHGYGEMNYYSGNAYQGEWQDDKETYGEGSVLWIHNDVSPK